MKFLGRCLIYLFFGVILFGCALIFFVSAPRLIHSIFLLNKETLFSVLGLLVSLFTGSIIIFEILLNKGYKIYYPKKLVYLMTLLILLSLSLISTLDFKDDIVLARTGVLKIGRVTEIEVIWGDWDINDVFVEYKSDNEQTVKAKGGTQVGGLFNNHLGETVELYVNPLDSNHVIINNKFYLYFWSPFSTLLWILLSLGLGLFILKKNKIFYKSKK